YENRAVRLSLFAKEFYVFRAFVEGNGFAALDEFANLLDDVRVGQGSNVAGVHAIGDSSEDAPHDFAGTRFGHVGYDMDFLGAGDLADHGFDDVVDLVNDLLIGRHAGFYGDVDLGNAAFDFVNDRYDGGFGNFGNREAGGFDFFGAQAVAGDIDDVVHAAEDAIVAVSGKHGAVTGEVGPVLARLAFRILAVFCVVLLHKTIRIAPDSLHDAGPGIANADISGDLLAGFDLLAVFVPDDRINSEGAGACAARLHAIESRLGGAEEAA